MKIFVMPADRKPASMDPLLTTAGDDRHRWFSAISLMVLVFFTSPCQAAVKEGYVVRVDGPTVYLDWGNASGIQPKDRFSVYRPGEPLKHPKTGEILGQVEEALGEGVVDHIEEKFSVGRVENASKPIQAGDRTRILPAAMPATAIPTPSGELDRAQGLHERWRSDPLPDGAVGLVAADVDGD